MDDFSKTPNIYPNLDEQQFILNKINEIKDYFLAEIRERELISKNLSKNIASLAILSGSISIASFASVIGVPAGIIGASFTFSFYILDVVLHFQLHQDL